MDVIRLIDIDDDNRLGVHEEQPDAREPVFNVVGLGKAILLEQLPHPLLGLDFLGQRCHAVSINQTPATDQDTVMSTPYQM